MENDCKEIAEMLVDYADGELSPAEANKVAGHLRECKNCQNILNALQKSIQMAEIIWENELSEIQQIQISTLIKPAKRRWPRYAAIAATILIAALFFAVRHQYSQPLEENTTFAEIEQKITKEGNAARLLAAADLLRTLPDARQITENQYHYILNQYPQTKAALEAKIRVEQFKKGDTK